MWSRPTEGRHAIVTAAGRDAVDADGASDEGTECGRRRRVVLASRCWCQVFEKQASQGRRWQESRSPGRARYKLVNHCAGNAGLPPLNLYTRVRVFLCTLHTRPRVQRAPGIPCSLVSRGTTFLHTLGRIAPRECEVMFAYHVAV